MSDPDGELIDTLRELKYRKDYLEGRLIFLEMKEEKLKTSLLTPIFNSHRVSEEVKDLAGLKMSITSSKENSQLKLHDSLKAVREWVVSIETSYADKSAYKNLKEMFDKLISLASKVSRVEEDKVMRELLIQALQLSYEWVNSIDVLEKNLCVKYQLVLLYKSAVEWISKIGEDDYLVVKTLVKYIIIASNWTDIFKYTKKSRKEITCDVTNYEENTEEENADEKETNQEVADEEDTDEEDENLRTKARIELQQSLQDIYDWVKSINAKPEERPIKGQLLDILFFTFQQARVGDPNDDVAMKDHLQETLLVSLSWVIVVNEERHEEMKHKLVDYLIFAIDWVNSIDSRGDDEVMRTLLRRTLEIAKEWQELIDSQ